MARLSKRDKHELARLEKFEIKDMIDYVYTTLEKGRLGIYNQAKGCRMVNNFFHYMLIEYLGELELALEDRYVELIKEERGKAILQSYE